MKVYCSTGAFIGRVNGLNHRLLTDYGHMLNCDGFEFMLFRPWYEKLNAVIADLKSCGLSYPVMHADKSIGDMISSCEDVDFEKCIDVWKINMETACAIGAGKVVTHIWGIPDSDKYLERLYERVLRLREAAVTYNLDMLGENCCCVCGSPLEHIRELLTIEPGMGFTIDTRPAQFHRELGDECAANELWSGAVRHLHISDFHGDKCEWSALYPIPAPGAGDVDFPAFFRHLKHVGYDASATLESPCMNPDRLDWETLNLYLDFIRNGMSGS